MNARAPWRTPWRAFAATLFEAAAIARLAAAAGKTYGVGAVVVTHAEHDAGSPTYQAELAQLWADYNQEIKPLTGQSRGIPMPVSQQHSVPTEAGARSAATQTQWRVGLDRPGDVVCSSPKYQYPYAPDHVHLSAMGYQMLGEKYGQIFHEKVVLGNDWQPLQPTRVERSGRVITVHFHVPLAPAWSCRLRAASWPRRHDPSCATARRLAGVALVTHGPLTASRDAVSTPARPPPGVKSSACSTARHGSSWC